MQLLDSQAASLEEPLEEWQGLKVKRESSAMFVQERIVSYHIIFHYVIIYHVVLYYVLYGGWPGSTRPKATVIAPKSNQHRDPNHIRKPTSYIMNTLSRTSPKNTKVLESSKSYIVNTLLYLHPRTCQLQAPSTRARRSRARQRCP